jgi:hypothetical protein
MKGTENARADILNKKLEDLFIFGKNKNDLILNKQ